MTIIVVTTLSSRGRALTSSGNCNNHSYFYNVTEYKSHCSSLLVRELKCYVRPKKDVVVSKNANVGNPIVLARLIPLLG